MASRRAEPSSPSPSTLPPSRRRLFAAFTLALPLFLFVIIELSLRLFGYGVDLSLFTTVELPAGTYLVMRPEVSQRYFPAAEFTPATSLDSFVRPKPAGTFRIFCMGGSTTVGYPYWYNAAFSTFLRQRLQALFPERSFEVINCGMTATNSFTVLDFARDLSSYETDLLLVYDGHNEFYGALGVASRQSPAGSRWLAQLSLRLVRFRMYQMLRNLYAHTAGLFTSPPPAEDRGTMMERLARGKNIPLGSPLYREGLATFRRNLSDLTDLCAERGTPLILSTQVSNLRTQYPFVSLPRADMTPGERQEFETAMARGRSAFIAGAADSALGRFRRACELDSLRADARFALARCLDTLGRKNDARTSYIRARDLDQLRFRTSSEFNQAIRSAGGRPPVSVVDMEAWFAAASDDSIVGNELIFEHLHPNSRGYFLMARAYAEEIGRRGLIVPPQVWLARDTLSEQRLWEDRIVTPLDERIAQRKVEILTSGWPFVDQVPTVPAMSAADTLGQIAEEVTRGRSSWERAHEEASAFYARRGEVSSEERELTVIISQMPLDIQPRLSLAHILLQQRDLDGMRAQLLATLQVQPTILAYRALGDLAMRRGAPREAVGYYRGILPFRQSIDEKLENGYLLGIALAGAGESDSAAAEMHRLLALSPDFVPAKEFLRRTRAPSVK